MAVAEFELVGRTSVGKRRQVRRVKSEIRRELPDLLERPDEVLDEVKCAFFGCEPSPEQSVMLAKWFEVRSHFLQTADAACLVEEKKLFDKEMVSMRLNRSPEMVRALSFITSCFTETT